MSYAGFLDMAIVTGTAVSHGIARYAFLQSGTPTAATESAFVKTLADSVLKDFCYKNVVREDILAFVRNDLVSNPDNFWQPDIDREAILARLESGMEAETALSSKIWSTAISSPPIPPGSPMQNWAGAASRWATTVSPGTGHLKSAWTSNWEISHSLISNFSEFTIVNPSIRRPAMQLAWPGGFSRPLPPCH